jgi:hypothetical protein
VGGSTPLSEHAAGRHGKFWWHWRRFWQFAVAGVVMLAPLAITEFLIQRLFSGSTLVDFVPSYPNDEIHYWHEIATFAEAGFGGGYYTYNEQPAPADFTHFGPHGPLFPLTYGTVGRVTGWQLWSPVVFNGVVLLLGLLAFFALTGARAREMLLAGTVLTTSFAVMIYVPSAMQESLHHGIALLLAGLLCRIAVSTNPRDLALFIAVVAVSSFIGPLWAIALTPALLLGLRIRMRWRLPVAAGATIVLVAIAWYGWRLLSAPVPGVQLQVATGTSGISTEIAWDNTVSNLRHLTTGINNVFHEPGLLLTTYLALFVFAACVFLVAREILQRRSKDSGGLRSVSAELTGAVVLLALFAAIIPFYIDVAMAFNRVVMPFLLFTLLVAIGLRRQRWLPLTVVAVNLVFMPKLVDAYEILRWGSFAYNRADLAAARTALERNIEFERSSSPWCNTLLTSQYDALQLVALPPGVGYSTTYGSRPPAFPRSKYILIGSYWPSDALPRAHLRELAKLSFGTLYLNSASQCRQRDAPAVRAGHQPDATARREGRADAASSS